MKNHARNSFDTYNFIDEYAPTDTPDHPIGLIVACRQFDARFKTEADCIEELVKILGPDFLYCRHCQSREVRRRFGTRVLLCFACRKSSSVFSNSIYDKIKKPRAWLLANWLIGQGVDFNSNQFRIPARVAYSSGLTILKKLATIIKSDMENELEALGSKMFIPIFIKRSDQTPAREHPRAEQYEMEKSDAYLEDVEEDQFLDDEPIRATNLDDLNDLAKTLYELLSNEKIHFDQLLQALNCSVGELCTAIFELDMLDLIQRHGGEYYTKKEKQEPAKIPSKSKSKSESESESNIFKFIKQILTLHHGISRKCLQLYLALFWSKYCRVRWNKSGLAQACRKHRPIRGREVLSYVTPLLVNLVGIYSV